MAIINQTNAISTLTDMVDVKSVNSLNYTVNNALFMTALANLEWSRGYLWYVELDDVPFPFQRGGVLGLPVTDVNYTLITGNEHQWGGFEQYSIPLNRNQPCDLSMTILDDEKGTIFTFLERWYNNIYNSKAGVLPVSEACKAISIYKLKSTRARISRYTYGYNLEERKAETRKTSVSRDFLIYPIGSLQESNSYDNKVRSYNVQFRIAHQLNPDYGNPSVHEGILDKNGTNTITSFIQKAASYF